MDKGAQVNSKDEDDVWKEIGMHSVVAYDTSMDPRLSSTRPWPDKCMKWSDI